MKLIEINIDHIIELCRRYRVLSLAVFGSILTDRFNENSDVDLLVDFDTTDHEQWDYVGNYFGFRDALEVLLGRKVDLIERRGIRNPLFLKLVEGKKRIIYG
ncbi:MAG: nucleotidyltransferase [Bacteroides sp.]|nr:nucleotidyltransferase [Bacteroidales bacterium]MBD5292127.1 nucleotidyltransferase [Bacteroides sp.]MBD5338741.1 nucleotidyltransferase [Bacteroides sp.]MDE6805406.1 nucleotidyltransferase domain-containing protein [Muribaculaceae bacterium]MDE7508875.1 nucleotidyltransferase domain-containing protein [Muribaculaceae bacterium]